MAEVPRAWLHPLTRQAVIDIVLSSPTPPLKRLAGALASARLAERIAAIDLLTRLSGDEMGYDPWKPEDSPQALERWKSWADDAMKNGIPAKVFRSLTESEVIGAIRRLANENPDIVAKARRMLVSGGTPILPLVKSAIADPVTTPSVRNVLEEVHYTVLAPKKASLATEEIGRVLGSGSEEARLGVISTLRESGEDALPILTELIASPSVTVRETTYLSLAAIRGGASTDVLLAALASEKDSNARMTLIKEIGKRRDGRVLPGLLSSLSGDEECKVAAIEAVGTVYKDLSGAQKLQAGEALQKLILDASWRIRLAVLKVGKEKEISNVTTRSAELIEDPDPLVRLEALRMAAKSDRSKVEKTLVSMFVKGGDERALAVEAIAGSEIAVPKAISSPLLKAESQEMLDLVRRLSSRAEVAASFIEDSPNEAVASAAMEVVSLEDSEKPLSLNKVRRVAEKGTTETARRQALAVLLKRFSTTSADKALYENAAVSDDPPTRLSGLIGLFLCSGDAAERAAIVQKAGAILESAVAESLGSAFTAAGEAFASRITALSDDELAVVKRVPRLSDSMIEYILDYTRRSTGVSNMIKGIQSGVFPPVASACRASGMLYDTTVSKTTAKGLAELVASGNQEMRWAGLILAASLADSKSSLGRTGKRTSVSGDSDLGSWTEVLKAIPSDDETPLTRMLVMLLRAEPDSAGGLDLAASAAASAAASDNRDLRYIAAHVLSWGFPYCLDVKFKLDGKEYEVEAGKEYYSTDKIPIPPLSDSHKAALKKLSVDPDPRVRNEALIGLLRYGDIKSDYTPLAALYMDSEKPWRLTRRLQQALGEARRGVPHVFYDALVKAALDDQEYDRDDVMKIAGNLTRDDRDAFYKATGSKSRSTAALTKGVRPAGQEALRPDKSSESGVVPRTPSSEAGSERMTLAFFHKKGCRECARVKDMLSALKDNYPGLEIRTYDIADKSSLELNEALASASGVPVGKRLVAPAVFTASGALVTDDIQFGPLTELVVTSAGRPAPWEVIAPGAEEKAVHSISERFKSYGLLTVLGAGLLDGVNPCAFTTIIFLMSYLALRKRSRREIALTGMTFTVGVFLTYLLVGMGLLEAVQALSFMPAISSAVYFLTALLALLAAGLSVVDGVLALRGREKDMLLSLPEFFRLRIQATVREGMKSRWIVLAAFTGGMVISLLELACTGQVYAPTIVFMTRLGEERLRAYSYLVLYNLMFILPLVAVFGVTLYGVGSQKVADLFRKHIAAVKFLMAALFGGLAVLLFIM